MFIANVGRTVCLLVLAVGVGSASRPSTASLVEARFNVVLDHVTEDPSLSLAALELFRGLAEDEVHVGQAEVALGLRSGEAQLPRFGSVVARAAAYRAIARLATPEATSYLEGISADDFAQDEIHTLWPAARIALYEAKLAQEPTWADRARVLEEVIVSEDHDSIVHSKLTTWAANELCNNGRLSSLAVVEKLYREWSGESATEKARFCGLRMRAVASNPDRITAIGSVLQVKEGLADDQLTRWAIRELTEMKSQRADDVMERFEQEVLALPDGSPQKRELMPYADAIRRRNGMVPPRSREAEGR